MPTPQTLRGWLGRILDSGASDPEMRALAFACSWLRGFSPASDRAGLWSGDALKWAARHGPPTRESLLAWADRLGVEADIPAPAALRNLGERYGDGPPGRD